MNLCTNKKEWIFWYIIKIYYFNLKLYSSTALLSITWPFLLYRSAVSVCIVISTPCFLWLNHKLENAFFFFFFCYQKDIQTDKNMNSSILIFHEKVNLEPHLLYDKRLVDRKCPREYTSIGYIISTEGQIKCDNKIIIFIEIWEIATRS